MNKRNTIYLTDVIIGNEENYINTLTERIHDFWNIPTHLRQYFCYDGRIRARFIEYICPKCHTKIRAEQNEFYEGDINCNSKFKKGTSDYKFCQEIEKSITNKFDSFVNRQNKDFECTIKTTKCPLCNTELIKEYPFTTMNGTWHLRSKIHRNNSGFTTAELNWRLEYGKKFVEEFDNWRSDSTKSVFINWESFEEFKLEQSYNSLNDIFVSSASEKVDSLILSCNQNTNIETNHLDINAKDLTTYISHLLNIESSILFLTNRLKSLYFKKAENDNDIFFENNYPSYESIKILNCEINELKFKIKKATQERDRIEKSNVTFKKLKKPEQPKKPILLKAHLFNKKKIEAQNAQLMSEYEERMKQFDLEVHNVNEKNKLAKEKASREKEEQIIKYNQAIEDYAAQIDNAKDNIQNIKNEKKKKKEIPSKSFGTKQIIDAEINIVENMLKDSLKCRSKMYSYDIVFDKYRNVVALSSFYEYLVSGRCESLVGRNGAYNIYENEIRLDAIITQLDEIKTKLDEIKQNQYMIYKTMKDIESSLNRLEASMDQAVDSLDSIDTKATTMNNYLANLSQNSEVIAHNTAVSAYYSKKNAELTNALGFMVALK